MGDAADATDADVDATVDEDPTTWWGRLMPTSEDASRARHVDRAASSSASAATTATRGGGLMLRMRSSVVGRIVMNKDGTARAKTQPADVALDVASGACARAGGGAGGAGERRDRFVRFFFGFFEKRVIDLIG